MEHYLHLPIEDEQIRALQAGDIVYLSGTMYTGRDAAHKRLVALLEDGKSLPMDAKGSAIYYTGPCPAPPGFPIGSCGPTTSYRMDAYSPRLMEAGMKILIGKGQRSLPVKQALQNYGGVYLAATGGAGALLAECVTACEAIAFHDLGTEAIHKLEVENFPAIVATDCRGNDLYDSGRREYALKMRLAQPEDTEDIWNLYMMAKDAMQAAGLNQWNDSYPTREFLAKDLARQTLWVCDDGNGKLLGALTCDEGGQDEYPLATWERHLPARYFHRVAVRPDVQRGGIATRMLQQIEYLVTAQGKWKALRLDTREDNIAARRLYEKLGFTYQGVCYFDDDPGSTYVVMEKHI